MERLASAMEAACAKVCEGGGGVQNVGYGEKMRSVIFQTLSRELAMQFLGFSLL